MLPDPEFWIFWISNKLWNKICYEVVNEYVNGEAEKFDLTTPLLFFAKVVQILGTPLKIVRHPPLSLRSNAPFFLTTLLR